MGWDDFKNFSSHPIPWDVFQKFPVPWDAWDGIVLSHAEPWYRNTIVVLLKDIAPAFPTLMSLQFFTAY
jgi:hypothetical protein